MVPGGLLMGCLILLALHPAGLLAGSFAALGAGSRLAQLLAAQVQGEEHGGHGQSGDQQQDDPESDVVLVAGLGAVVAAGDDGQGAVHAGDVVI